MTHTSKNDTALLDRIQQRVERAKYPEAECERFRKIRFYMENAELYSFALTT